MLHVTSGDCAAEQLRRAVLPGEVLAWRDSPAVGPAPAGLPVSEWRALRAGFWGVPAEQMQDAAALAQANGSGEIVLWFDACPWDQVILIELLASLGTTPLAHRLSLLVVADHPDVERYSGLGQLSPGQLAPFFPTRKPVGPAQLDLAVRAWAAHGAPDPRGLERLLHEDTSALPHLAPALARLLEELPSTANGLARSEEQALRAIAGGARRFAEVSAAVTAMERPHHGLWHGDGILLRTLLTLASPPAPAIEIDGELSVEDGTARDDARMSALPFGEALLGGAAGRPVAGADWVAGHGVDRWRGGVHLAGRGPLWRRDAAGSLAT